MSSNPNYKLPSLMSALLRAATARIATNQPLKAISDYQLLKTMSEVAEQLYLTRHTDFVQTDTVEKLLAESIRLGCTHGANWAYDDNSKYSEVMNIKHLTPLVVADHLPEMVIRYHALAAGDK